MAELEFLMGRSLVGSSWVAPSFRGEGCLELESSLVGSRSEASDGDCACGGF